MNSTLVFSRAEIEFMEEVRISIIRRTLKARELIKYECSISCLCVLDKVEVWSVYVKDCV